MRVDAFAIPLRPRANFEAADLGVRLCQSSARDVFTCYLGVYVPLVAAALACYEIAPWLPYLVVWWSKPWLDRTILFTLSRAAFGQRTRPIDVWHEQRQVWWSQLFRTLTLQRLSLWRSFTQPIYQLEGLRGAELRAPRTPDSSGPNTRRHRYPECVQLRGDLPVRRAHLFDLLVRTEGVRCRVTAADAGHHRRRLV